MDHSAIEAIESLSQRYRDSGRSLYLRHLSPDCYELLDKTRSQVLTNALEDPSYHIADDRLG